LSGFFCACNLFEVGIVKPAKPNIMRLLLLSFIFSINSFGQQDPLLRTDGFTPFWNNPASYGARNLMGVNTAGRLQWPSLSGQMQSLLINADFALWMYNKVDNSLPTNGGIGLMYSYDNIGFLSTHHLKIPINYKFRFEHSNLALGAGLGFRNQGFDNFTFGDSVSTTARQTNFDMDAGLFYNHEQFYVGFSVTQLTAPYYDVISYQGTRHYYLQGGYQFDLGKVKIYPQTQLAYVNGFQGAWLMNYLQFWEEKVSLGLGLGSGSTFMGALRLNWNQWSVNYVYEVNNGPLTNASGASHELRLAFEIKQN